MEDNIKKDIQEIQDFKSDSIAEIEEFRIKFLGKKGLLNSYFVEFKSLESDQKKKLGSLLNELKNNPTSFLKMPSTKMIMKSRLVAQYQEGVKKGIYTKVEPIHFVTNIMSLIVFPFMCSPILKKMEKLNTKEFNTLMLERKKSIPKWIIKMIKK